jgi:hypothetical protein
MSGVEPKPKFSLPLDFDFTKRVQLTKAGTLAPVKSTKTRVSLEGKIGSRIDPTNYRGNGHWEWDGPKPLGTSKKIGFIYMIKDLTNDMLYLGKKQYVGAGKINKGQESNWRWYISSSNELSESVKTSGKDKFRFIAIEEYSTKGSLSYAETWSLLYAQTPVHRRYWYNVLINKISWTVREPPTDRHKERMRAVMDSVGAPHDFSPNKGEDTL